jgi:hypothetical protein
LYTSTMNIQEWAASRLGYFILLPQLSKNSSSRVSMKCHNDVRPCVSQAVSRLLLTAHARVRYQTSPCVIDKAALEQVFLLALRFSPVSIITPVLDTLTALLSHRRCTSLVDIKHPTAPRPLSLHYNILVCATSISNVLTLVL